MRQKFLIIVLMLLLVFQFVFSFLLPSVGDGPNWLPPEAYTPKYSQESSDNFLLDKVAPLFFRYRINSDVGRYLEMAGDFSREMFNDRGRWHMNRPLYPFLVFLVSLPIRLFGAPSYGTLFALAILINFLFAVGTVLLLFCLLKKIFSKNIAFFSCLLLVLSPFFHNYTSQVMPEMLTAFFVVLTFYFLHNYLSRPIDWKLIVFSLALGLLFLGKMFFALPLFVFVLALIFKKFKQAFSFAVIFSIPFGLWYFWITKVWALSYFADEIQHWQMGIWVIDMLYWPWYKIGETLLSSVPEFFSHLIYAFMLVPVVLAVIGLKKLSPRIKYLFYGFTFCVFLQGFLIGLYYRHIFMLFPFVYPAAALGIQRIASHLKKYRPWFSPAFWIIILAIILIISNLNIYRIFPYTH